MVMPTKINPPQDPQEPQKAQAQPNKDSTNAKSTTPTTDDGSKKPFKEVLETAMNDKQVKPTKVIKALDDDDDDDVMSLLDLAGQTKTGDVKGKAVVTSSFVADNDTDDGTVKATVSGSVSSDVAIDVDDDTASDVSVPTVKPTTVKPVVVDASVKVAETTDVKTAPVDPGTVKVANKVSEEDKPVVQGPAHAVGALKKDEHLLVRKVKEADAATTDVDVTKDKKEEVTASVVATPAPHTVYAANVQAPVEIKTSSARENLLKLAQSMVDQIQLVKASGKTDTEVTLKYPPMFEGVKVKITEFDTSKNQFNVTFSDVNNATARSLIEQQDNQIKLQQALFDKGYNLQMITIEQKIPGLASTESGEASLNSNAQAQDQAGNATDQDEGNVT